MNLLQAYNLLNMLTEDYQEEYKKYILEHVERVSKVADWLKENLPELFEEIDIDEFDDLIKEHDKSKWSEEEFEPYAQYFYGNKKESPEFDKAWEHHWMNNKHHPEYWQGEDIPYIYILEMLCDWGSFSIEKKDFNELINFYYSTARDDKEKNLSDTTKKIIEDILDKIISIIEE